MYVIRPQFFIPMITLLRNAAQTGDHTTLFKMTETYRAGAEGQVKTTG